MILHLARTTHIVEIKLRKEEDFNNYAWSSVTCVAESLNHIWQVITLICSQFKEGQRKANLKI